MKSRKDLHKKKKIKMSPKLIALILFVGLTISSSVGIAFASGDISSLFSNWFHTKSNEAIETIDNEINREQKVQTDRLQEEMRLAVESTNSDISAFVDREVEKRIKELQDYASYLIGNIDTSDPNEKQRIISRLNATISEAIRQMNRDIGFRSDNNEPVIEEEEEEEIIEENIENEPEVEEILEEEILEEEESTEVESPEEEILPDTEEVEEDTTDNIIEEGLENEKE